MKKILKYCDTCPYRDKAGVSYKNVGKKDIMIISDYPYESDIKADSIFSGIDKLVINTALKSIDIKNSDICFANACRCTIDKKKDSTKEQNSAITHCKEYIKLAISVVKPKVIVVLGAIALKQMLGNKAKIMESRGQFVFSEEFNCYILPTVHPSYCSISAQLKYPNVPIESMSIKERLIFKDFQLLQSFVNNGYKVPELKTENYKKVDDIELLGDVKYFSIDCETTGLDLFNSNTKVLCWGISQKEGESQVIIL